MLIDETIGVKSLQRIRVSSGYLYSLRAQPAEAPLAAAIVIERTLKALLVEVRPQAIAEVQFRKRRLPEQKITEPSFVAGADQQIDGTRCVVKTGLMAEGFKSLATCQCWMMTSPKAAGKRT